MSESVCCPGCGKATTEALLAEAHWYPYWERDNGACPACVQENLLRTLLTRGDAALHQAIQTAWPLDAEAAFGAMPTRLRLHADPRFTGAGVTIALADSGFYPHPDLVKPHNRIRAWADATVEPVLVRRFGKDDTPTWPDWDQARDCQWHGTMTSVVAAGNGFLSHGLYSGLACSADLVLIQVRGADGHISNANIERALEWIASNGAELGIGVVSLSVSGDPDSLHAVDNAVMTLIDKGISVVAAAGNDGERRLTPPATAPLALTVGGIDDKNVFGDEELSLWHSNYGLGNNDVPKPELVAPSIWVAAPVLPGTAVAQEAEELFLRRGGRREVAERIEELKLITPHYQHAEGTSFAAPVVASTIACLLEANPRLNPILIREALVDTAQPVPGADRLRQGAGALNSGAAVAHCLAEKHAGGMDWQSPRFSSAGVSFVLHEHHASKVEVVGSWNGWQRPGTTAFSPEAGIWRTEPMALPAGRFEYKYMIDGAHWLDDPANPQKAPDGHGGFNSCFLMPINRGSGPQR